MDRLLINKLVVVGVGLIGGSFALALRKAGVVKHIVGIGRSRENLQLACELGAIDETAADITGALQGADFVLIAVPVGETARVMSQIEPHLEAQTVLTDAGSTKQDVARSAYRHLSRHLARFVPGHPIAGAELSGVRAAQAELFQGKKIVLTPLPENDEGALERVRAVWQACGATLHEMSAPSHDAVFAAVSHLPHLLAYALVHYIAIQPNSRQLFDYAAGGFRDFTRIAGSSPEMWRDICLANRESLLSQLESYADELDNLREMLANGDAAGLKKLFNAAGEARQKWLDKEER